MAAISFYAFDASLNIQNLSGSGLGFFGATGFGNSVEVGEWQGTTYITDSTGSSQGPAVVNTKYTHSASGINSIIGTDSVNLQYIPNRLATLEIRFTHDTSVKTQNVKLRIFDRSNVNNPASGVTTKVAQLIHPDPNQANISNSSDSSWTTPAGSSVIMDLIASPGRSGERPNGASTSDTEHSWYTVISASPDSVGSKTMYALFVQLEYL